jgi:hypothetical protein
MSSSDAPNEHRNGDKKDHLARCTGHIREEAIAMRRSKQRTRREAVDRQCNTQAARLLRVA